MSMFFFFQAEDGIRDIGVTGSSDVCSSDLSTVAYSVMICFFTALSSAMVRLRGGSRVAPGLNHGGRSHTAVRMHDVEKVTSRSEERRVGKECRSRWSPYH